MDFTIDNNTAPTPYVDLATLPADHPLRTSPLAEIRAQYRHQSSRGKDKGWKDVENKFRIAKVCYNQLGAAWLDFDDWRAPQQ